MKKRVTIQSVLLTTLWLAIGAGTTILLVAAIQKKDGQHCKGINITIEGVSKNYFVDKIDIQKSIRAITGGNPVGKAIGSFDLKTIEQELQSDIWIKNAQLFFDNNEMLQVNVLEREPVARVFTNAGSTFYLDSSLTMLPMSDKFSARLPVFTGFGSDKKVLLKADSILLKDILTVSAAIHADSFMMAMIEQVDITGQKTFEMVPKIGNTIIEFGDAQDVEEKFKKLQLFYNEVMVKAGWNKYTAINVQYKNQVVARRKGAADVSADSVRTLQIMKAIAENAERMSADSLQTIVQDNENNTTNKNLIQQSMERDDNNEAGGPIENISTEPDIIVEKPIAPPTVISPKPVINKPEKKKTADKKPVVKKEPAKKTSAPVKKTVLKPKAVDTKKPKLVMPKAIKPGDKKPANDY